MGATVQVNETTSFVYESGKLIPVEEATNIEQEKQEARREFSKRQLAEDEYWMLVPSSIREREWPMFQTITYYTLEKVKEYLELLAQDEAARQKTSNSTTYVSTRENAFKDAAKGVMNSQVLERLISGRDLLPTAPPKSYYHNWYDLVDDGEAVCIDVSFTTYSSYDSETKISTPKQTLRIDGEEWKVLEVIESENGGSEYIVQWKETDYIYKLSAMTAEDYDRMLHPYQRKLVKKNEYSWKLTRIDRENSNG